MNGQGVDHAHLAPGGGCPSKRTAHPTPKDVYKLLGVRGPTPKDVYKLLGVRGPTPKDVYKLLGVSGPTPKDVYKLLGVQGPTPKDVYTLLGHSGGNLGLLGGLDGQFHQKTDAKVGDPLAPTHPQGCVQTAGGQWTHPKGCVQTAGEGCPAPQEQGAHDREPDIRPACP
eukprot:scaffold54206_cov69-Phaeocystis_antarctica.AAC.1